jgi:hypothetical protein
MEKSNLIIPTLELVEFKFNKQIVIVDPYITLANKVVLIRHYVENLFNSDDLVANYVHAEWQLVLEICNDQTSIKLLEESDNVELEQLFSSGLWIQVQDHLVNYTDFRGGLWEVVKNIKDQKVLESSVGTVINKISDKVFEFIDKLMAMNLTDETVKELVAKLGEYRQEVSNFDSTFGTLEPKKKKIVKKGTA